MNTRTKETGEAFASPVSFMTRRDRTHLNGSVRWTLPATSSKTGGNHNFYPERDKNANRSRSASPQRGDLSFGMVDTGIEPI